MMATTFLHVKEILLIEYLKQEHTITGQYYATLIDQLRESTKEGNKESWRIEFCFIRLKLHA